MKYALIGCGRIAVNHIKAALNNKLEIVAVCDVIPEKMEALLAKYELQSDQSIKRYTDYKEMIEAEKPELASIATESGIHAGIALHCIDKGINVIIEKPMAMSMEDADKIIEAATAKNVKVSACHQNRFNVAIQELRKALEADVSASFRTALSMSDGTETMDIMIRHPGEVHGLKTAAL